MAESLSDDELKQVLETHRLFVKSKGEEGERFVLKGRGLPDPGSLAWTDLTGADLSGSVLEGMDFSCSWMENADLSGSSFKGSFFDTTTLSGADCRGCDFSGCTMEGCDTFNARFEGAVWTGAAEKLIPRSERLRDILKILQEKTDPVLEEGKIYRSDYITSENGHSGGIFHSFSDGKLDVSRVKELLDVVWDMPCGSDVGDLMKLYPVHSMITVTLQRGTQPELKVLKPADLIAKLEEETEHECCEALIRLGVRDGNLVQKVVWNKFRDGETETWDLCPGKCDDYIECLYYALDGELERLHLVCREGKLTLRSIPAYPKLGMEAAEAEKLTGTPDFEEQHQAAEEARSMRQDLYAGLGNLHPETFWFRRSGLRDYPWPGQDFSGSSSSGLRVIHTDATTVLITSGLSDIYYKEKHDPDCKYNGIGMEFYVEFEGIIPFEEVRRHFVISMLYQTAQVAIGHGDFRTYLDGKGTTTVEMAIDSLHPYTLQDGTCREIGSFYGSRVPEKHNAVGVLLGMESEWIPRTMKLNREEVLLVSVRPFKPLWLKMGLRDGDDRADRTRQEMMEKYRNSGKGNLVDPERAT